MYKNSILNCLNLDETVLKDGIVYNGNKAIGLIRPSLVEGFDVGSNSNLLIGKSLTRIDKNLSKFEKFKVLCNQNIIVFGSSNKIVLDSHKFLKNPVSSRTSSYFLSFLSTCDDFIQAMDFIEKSNILILGCGGIGSMTSILLAGSGVKNITIVDGDYIEESNLNRQILWDRRDIGKMKVDILYEKINDRFLDINVHKVNRFYEEEELINVSKNYDLVIISADEPMGIGNSLASKNITSVIVCGYINTKLSFNFFSKDQCFNFDKKIVFRRTPNFIGPSFGPSNIEIAGIVSSFSLHFLSNIISKNSNKFMWDTISFPRDFTII